MTFEVLEDRLAPASLAGTIFADLNNNGVKDPNEIGLLGVTVNLTGPANSSVITDGLGNFSFLNLAAGTYSLSWTPPTGSLPGQAIAGTKGGTFSGTNTINGIDLKAADDGADYLFTVTGIATSAVSKRMFLASSTDADLPFSTRTNVAPTVTTPIADLTLGLNSPATVIQLPTIFGDADITNSQVRLVTSAGAINLDLLDAQAPVTVANFVNYIQSGRYDNTIFHRLATSFVLQGGGFGLSGSPPTTTLPAISTDPAIPNEFSASRSNVVGTVAMAKVGDDPNSATSQFFFNLNNNAGNLDVQNGGFTVFARLSGAADQTVVNALVNPPVVVQNHGSPFNQVPIIPPAAGAFPGNYAAANFDRLLSATVVRRNEVLTYSIVSNTAPGVVTAVVDPAAPYRLVVTPTGTAGTATITVRATDIFGATVDEQFVVTVLDDNVPTATVNITPDPPAFNATLTATVTPTDLDANPLTFTYVWKVTDANNNQQTVKTTTATASITDTLDLTTVATPPIVSGTKITVVVTANDGTLTGPAALDSVFVS